MLTKFTESDHEKVERLMELHFKYVDQVAITEDRLRNSTEEMDAVSDCQWNQAYLLLQFDQHNQLYFSKQSKLIGKEVSCLNPRPFTLFCRLIC